MKKLTYFGQLLKFRLSTTVVFSAVVGYLLGIDTFILSEFIILIFGGFLVTGSANAFNQIIEKDTDKLMDRTMSRPLPKGNLSVIEAIIFSSFMAILGLYCLYELNTQSSFFGLLSILLYVLSYTPLKRISTISIFVGALPGAIPFLLGWVAATDDFGLAAGTLFAIQFFWQFPHFIAIAWVLDEDYKKAGLKMLFGNEKGTYPAIISIVTSICMTIISVVPFFWGFPDLKLSVFAFIPVLFLGLCFTYKSYLLYKNTDDNTARQLMIASFIYLPSMQIIYVLDKFIF